MSMQDGFDRRYQRRGQPDLAWVRAALARLSADMTAVQAEQLAATHRVGRLTLPLLLIGGTNTQTLTWSKPMPSDSYQVSVQQDAAIIGSATTTVLSITASAVQVKTTATLAITAGAQLLVIAWNDS